MTITTTIEKNNKIIDVAIKYLDSDSVYELIDYNMELDKSLKEQLSWSDRFRKSWNITMIILLTAFVYIYYIYKRDPNTESKF